MGTPGHRAPRGERAMGRPPWGRCGDASELNVQLPCDPVTLLHFGGTENVGSHTNVQIMLTAALF